MAYKILITDDEKEIVKLLRLYLENDEVSIYEANNGRAAWEMFNQEQFDMLIVDIMMPELNGFELIKKVRQVRDVPIVIISARIDSSDKIFGFELGADDYVTKPFDPMEVTARVKAIFRRTNSQKAIDFFEEDAVLKVAGLKLDLNSCTVCLSNNVELELSATEFRMLRLFMQNPGRLFTKEEIYNAAWEEFFFDDNSLRVMVSKLRDKIGSDKIKTVRGLGYRMEKTDEKT
ncbi:MULTISPECIES: response regulator transcription factor [Enterococcus]|uniref:response regulator transcription factor n=1 Tax=Enterococcus TaxID=1350 RepID=UPI000EDC47FF|nr:MULTISPECIES: response regulator transcription factor [Enterococcus]HCM87715.1 DNA-binding response regulator [Enterococcus sp.]